MMGMCSTPVEVTPYLLSALAYDFLRFNFKNWRPVADLDGDILPVPSHLYSVLISLKVNNRRYSDLSLASNTITKMSQFADHIVSI